MAPGIGSREGHIHQITFPVTPDYPQISKSLIQHTMIILQN
jgi:hypothetical protein